MTDENSQPQGGTGDEPPRDAPEGENPQELSAESTRGLFWVGSGRLLTQPIAFLSTIILARLLGPEDFGLVSMCAVFVGLAALGNEFGLMNALIQRQTLSRNETDSVFWLNMTIGVGFSLLGVAVAPLIAGFYEEPRLQPLFAVLSISFTLTSLGLVQNGLLRRKMDFFHVTMANTAAAWTASFTSVALAFAGLGVWSLILGSLSAAAANSLLLAVWARYVPRLHFRVSEAKRFAVFGASLTVSDFSNYGITQVDKLIIGKQLGTASVGAYTMAANLAMFPARKISTAVAGVTLPAFAQIQHQEERFSAAYRRATRLSAMVMFAPLAAAAVLAQELIIGLYGPEWAAAVVPFAILCLAGMVRSVSLLTGVVFKGIGRPEVEMRWSVSGLAAAALLVFVGIQWGLPGAAAGLALASLLIWIPTQISACRLLRLPSWSFFKELLQPVVTAMIAAAAAYALRTGLNMFDLPEIAVALLALSGALGATWLVTRSVGWFDSVREIESLASSSLKARLKRRRAVSPEQEDGS